MIYRNATNGAVMIVIKEFHHLFHQNYGTAFVTSLAVMVQEYIRIETIVGMTHLTGTLDDTILLIT